jgi:hypothetical protein
MTTSKVDEYRVRASEAEQLAKQTANSVIKEQALKIAEQWRYMANYEEKRGGGRPANASGAGCSR